MIRLRAVRQEELDADWKFLAGHCILGTGRSTGVDGKVTSASGWLDQVDSSQGRLTMG